jgi:tetratricopeptide (TPR) repeat protein
MGRYHDVLELVPSLEASFRKLGMHLEAVKCRLLLAVTQKMTGENQSALAVLSELQTSLILQSDGLLRARVLTELGDVCQLQGDFEKAMEAFQGALSLLQGNELSSMRATLKLCVGAASSGLGSFRAAVEAYREAHRDYQALGMRAQVAYTHLLIAEALLELEREREAEWEVRAALPIINEIKMLPEAVAAVALLGQSVSQRKTDPKLLRTVREHLHAEA